MNGQEPTLTVDFLAPDDDRFLTYAADRAYIRIGPRLSSGYYVAYTDEAHLDEVWQDLGSGFQVLPKPLSPVDSLSNEAAGITQVLGQPFLDLSGTGVIIGFVDTGIDFTLPCFRQEDGSTRLLYLWDQTLEGEGDPFGAVYDREEIDRALLSPEPLSLLPSRDTDGHGTFLASVACGSGDPEVAGAAPGASLICVKLRRASDYYIRRYLLPPDDPYLFESTDMLLGVQFILDRAAAMQMPAVICIGLGSNFSPHDGTDPAEEFLALAASRPGVAVTSGAGNESNARHHTQGRLLTGAMEKIDVRSARRGASFGVMLYAAAFDRFSVGITSPGGESVGRVPFRSGSVFRERLLLDRATITIRYARGSNTVIWVGVENAGEGIWEIRLYGDDVVDGRYWAWLPITGQADPGVEFLRPVPENTVVFPSAAEKTVCCGAYNSVDGSLFISSSWGPNRSRVPAPDLVAPGVNIRGCYPQGVGTMTGTSAAAAVTAGASALLLEWGIVKENYPDMNGETVRNLLISGAARRDDMIYPNVKWGYGQLHLYNSFLKLRSGV